MSPRAGGSAPPRPAKGAAAARRSLSGGESASRARFEERATQARWQRRKRAAMIVLAGLVLAGLVWLVGFSSVLAVGSATVEGAESADHDAIEDIAMGEVGTPLARVDAADLESRITRAIPAVKRVEVDRGWPTTLNLKVTSRVPAVAVTGDEGVRLVDLDGVAFRDVAKAPSGVPALATEGDSTEVTAQGVAAALEMMRALPADLRDRVKGIRVNDADQVSFSIGSTRIVWGDEASGTEKVALIELLIADGPSTIDVSAPDTPVTTD